MPEENYISIQQFCAQNQVDLSFIHLLNERGLMEIIILEEVEFIPANKLPLLEKCMHFHYELEINMEGIEAIQHLLQKVEDLQQEIIILKNRLSFYEQEQL
ncbi:MAG: MerR family transcriptional regulator [Chitinophagaceae bacterium]|jgi:hypothetical protein|nr:MerR family transcriptional regulator [Chitinophagaceae bacterium]